MKFFYYFFDWPNGFNDMNILNGTAIFCSFVLDFFLLGCPFVTHKMGIFYFTNNVDYYFNEQILNAHEN